MGDQLLLLQNGSEKGYPLSSVADPVRVSNRCRTIIRADHCEREGCHAPQLVSIRIGKRMSGKLTQQIGRTEHFDTGIVIVGSQLGLHPLRTDLVMLAQLQTFHGELAPIRCPFIAVMEYGNHEQALHMHNGVIDLRPAQIAG
ncbi:hypothetical protein D3C81_1881010 [compost metagenome]